MTRRIFSIILMVTLFLGSSEEIMAVGYPEEMIDAELQEIVVKYHGGMLHVVGANNMIVTIFNVAGMPIKSFKVEGQDKRINLPLSDGLYLVKVGRSTTRKILVKN